MGRQPALTAELSYRSCRMADHPVEGARPDAIAKEVGGRYAGAASLQHYVARLKLCGSSAAQPGAKVINSLSLSPSFG